MFITNTKTAIYIHEVDESNITQISVLNCPPPENQDIDSQVSIFNGSANCLFHYYTSGRHQSSSGIRLSHRKEKFSVSKFFTTNQHERGSIISFIRKKRANKA